MERKVFRIPNMFQKCLVTFLLLLLSFFWNCGDSAAIEVEKEWSAVWKEWSESPVTKFRVQRPRLYFTKEEIPLLKKRANEIPGPSPAEWKEAGKLGYIKSEQGGFYYWLTGKEYYREMALKGYRSLLDTDLKKVERGWLDVPGISEELCYTYDWLYDDLSEEERRKGQEKIIEAMEGWTVPGLKDPHRQGPSLDQAMYHNGFYIALISLITAGYTLAGDHPKGEEYIKMAYQTFLGRAVRAFLIAGKGGGWWEGQTYQHMSVPCIVKFIEVVRVASGVDLFQCDVVREFLHKNAYYTIYASYPWINKFNWDESKLGYLEMEKPTARFMYLSGDAFGKLRYAGQHKRRFLPYILTRTQDGRIQYWLNHSGNQTTWSFTGEKIWEILWYDRDISERPLDDLPLTNFMEGLGLIFMRSDWSDQSTWVSFQCGKHYSFHYWGQNNLVTLQREGALLPEQYGGGSFIEGMMGIGGCITAFDDGPYYTYILGDQSEGSGDVKPRVSETIRQVVYLRPNTIVIFDRLSSREKEVNYMTHYHNEPRIEGSLITASAYPYPWSLLTEKELRGQVFHRALFPKDPLIEKTTTSQYRIEWFVKIKHKEKAKAIHFLNVIYAGTQEDKVMPETELLKKEGALGAKITADGRSYEVYFNLAGEPGGSTLIREEKVGGKILVSKEFPTEIRNVPNILCWQKGAKVFLPR